MKFARLLTAGKSLVGLGEGGPRYRMNKKVQLPKFGGPKNPFMSAEEKSSAQTIEPAPRVIEKSVAPGPKLEAVVQAKAVGFERPKAVGVAKAKLNRAAKHVCEFGSVVGARSLAVAADWARKLSPFVPRKQPRTARSAAPVQAPTQCELSLDRVQVVRNDLSDTDFELRQTSRAKPKAAAAVAEKLEPVGAAWNRLTTKFFGEDQT